MCQSSIVIPALVFLFGLAIGSFLNVCIARLPREEPAERSVVRPRSRCPQCQAPIKPYDNIPVLSYLLLRGRCRACAAPISPLYPLVELLTAGLFLASYAAFGLTLVAVKWAALAALLVVLFFTDLRERFLPDAVNFFGLGLGLALGLFVPLQDGTAAWLAGKLYEVPPPDAALGLADAVLGAAVGGGLLWLVGEGYFRLRGREGMGLGDVKMMFMVGAFLGVKRTLLTILLGSLLGSVLGLLFILVARKDSSTYELPFGTFLALAAALVIFLGTPILDWYSGLFAWS